jgi:hypothetical protein
LGNYRYFDGGRTAMKTLRLAPATVLADDRPVPAGLSSPLA